MGRWQRGTLHPFTQATPSVASHNAMSILRVKIYRTTEVITYNASKGSPKGKALYAMRISQATAAKFHTLSTDGVK